MTSVKPSNAKELLGAPHVAATRRKLLAELELDDAQNLGDRCVFVGLGNRVELVGEAIWDAEQASMTPERFTELYDIATGAGPAASAPTA